MEPPENLLQNQALPPLNFSPWFQILRNFFLLAQPRARRKKICAAAPLTGEEFLRQASRGGRGAIVLSAHVGPWELGAEILLTRGWKVFAVYQPYRSFILNRLFQKLRPGAEYCPAGAGAAGKCLRALAEGKIVCLLADWTAGETHPEPRPLFGRPARLPWGPATLAVRAGVAIVPATTQWERGKLSGKIFEPIWPAPGGVRELAEKTDRWLESVLRERPKEWCLRKPIWIFPPAKSARASLDSDSSEKELCPR